MKIIYLRKSGSGAWWTKGAIQTFEDNMVKLAAERTAYLAKMDSRWPD